MRSTKKIAISAMLVALGAVLMSVGALFEVMDLATAAFVSLFIVFAMIEIGMPYPWLMWISTSLITFLIFPAKTVWLMYLSFGAFPILKAYIERLPRAFWLILKLLYLNAVLFALYFLVELIFSVPLVTGTWWMIAIAFLLMNAAFIAYDRMLTLAVRYYFAKLKDRIKGLLK